MMSDLLDSSDSSDLPNYWMEVIQDFEKALESEDHYDVIIKVGEDSDAKELRAHSFVLRARCSYFKRALSGDWEEKDDDGRYIFKKTNISSEVFQLILRYLYTGIIDYNQYNKDVILQCLVAADELGLDKFIERIQEYLIKNDDFLLKDPVSTLQVIYQHEPFKNLRDHYLDIISEEPRVLFSSQKFSSLEKSIVTMVLQRDDLNMEEIDVWDSLLRWLFINNLKIDQTDNDDSTWSSEDLADVKQTIQEYIPLIRFYDISKEDFFLKVYPYKNLLPQDLLNDVLRFHMVPNSTPMLKFKPSRSRKTNSILINNNAFMIFAKWIDNKNKDYTQKNMPYKFKLLLRGTRDGFDAAKFHQLCDGQGATISFARVRNSNQIIGGYNPLSWSTNNSYANTNKSFLFKMDINNLSSAQVGRCNNNGNAVYNHSSYGPTFGSGHDLNAQGNTWNTNNGNSYTNISMPSSFAVDEYEVFQVIKKS